jgi:hypothetical protein
MIKQETNNRVGVQLPMLMVLVTGLVALTIALTMSTVNNGSDAGSRAATQAVGSKANSDANVYVELYDREFTVTGDQAEPEARTSFSSSADNQVYVRMAWNGVEQTHDAYVTFYSPDAMVYQVLDVPFITTQPDGKSAGASTDLYQNRPGVLHPVKVNRARMMSDGAVVWGRLPIAGTWMGRMPGTWQVEVRLDQNSVVLAKTTFELIR